MINKNLLEVCFSPDLGGLELYMCKCSKEFEKDFNVFNIISKESKLENYFKNTKNTIALRRKSSFSLFLSYKLAKIIDKKDIDIIHLHWTKDIPIVVLAKIFSKKKPKIIQSRHMTMTRFKSDFYHKFLYKNIDMMIAVTKEVERQLHKFIPSDIRPKIEQIYLGAQCPEKYPQKEISLYKESLNCNDNFIIGMVGRINEFKGQYLLIEAMNLLKEKNLNIKAFFVGHPMEEEYLDKLKNDVKKHNLENSIEFLGFTNEPHKFMQACDTLIMASKNETFGLVTIESMQMGTPVIGTNNGGVLEIIDDKENGLLFENRDSKSLSEKIELLCNSKELKNKLARAGNEKASNLFNHKKQIKKLIGVIK